MTNKKKINYVLFLSALLFLLITAFSMYFSRYVKENLSSVSIRYDTESISPKIINKILENLKNTTETEIPQLTLWNRLQKETIQNEITDAAIETNVIEVNGDMSQVIPMYLLAGSYPYLEDEKGCVMDSQTAFQLFGTTNAINNIVTWNGKDYIVRGVVRVKDTMMLLQVSKEEHLFKNVEAFYKSKVNKNLSDNEASELKSLLINNGAPEPDAVINGMEISWFLHCMIKIPIFITGVIVIGMYINITYQYRRSIVWCMVYGLCTVVIAFVVLKLIHFNIHIPSQYLPTKWSDFDFYVNKYKEIQKSIINRKNCELMQRDILLFGYRIKCMICVVIEVIISVLYYFLFHIRKHVKEGV